MRHYRLALIAFLTGLACAPFAIAADWGGGHPGGYRGGERGSGGYGGEHRGGAGRGGEGREPSGGGYGDVIINPYPDGPYPLPYPVPEPGPPVPRYPGPLPPSSGEVTVAAPVSPLPAAWFYCSDPAGFYPYVPDCRHEWQPMPVTPPPPGSGAPPSVEFWAFCADPAGYYPYVAACAQPWQEKSPATPREVELETRALWYYCEPEQAYFPYAPGCQENWLNIPAIAPPNPRQTQQLGSAN
jgi:hypothetical protein